MTGAGLFSLRQAMANTSLSLPSIAQEGNAACSSVEQQGVSIQYGCTPNLEQSVSAEVDRARSADASGNGFDNSFVVADEWRNSPTVADSADSVCCASVSGGSQNGVGNALRLSDEQREAAIKRAEIRHEYHRERRELALLEYDITGDFGAKGEADRHSILAAHAMKLQADLVKGRSPEMVAKLEGERGLG